MSIKRLSLYIVFICATSIMLISPVFSATYFVKNGGNDKASGLSDADAWATIAKVNDFAEGTGFSSGDIVQFKRGSTFNDETLGWDGSDIEWGTLYSLTFQDYGIGKKPIFDGDVRGPISISGAKLSGLTIKNLYLRGAGASDSYPNNHGAIYIEFVNGVTIDGIDGEGRGRGNPDNEVRVIMLQSLSGDVEVKNCNLHDWGPVSNPSAGPDCFGINIRGESTKTYIINNLSIHDNVIYNINADPLLISYFNPNGDPRKVCNIYNNTFYNGGENAIDIKASKYVNIYNNTFYRDGWGLGGTGDAGWLIVVHQTKSFPGADCDKVRIFDNNFTGNTDGIHTMGGIAYNTGNVLNMDIFGNKFTNVSPAISMSSGTFRIEQNIFVADEGLNVNSSLKTFIRQEATAIIKNNTFYASPDSTIESAIWSKNAANSEYVDNIIYLNTSSTHSYAYPLYVQKGTGDLPIVNYNNIYNPNSPRRIYWDDRKYNVTDLSEWRNSLDNGALFNDPFFKDVDNGDFSLFENSPCLLPDKTIGANQNYFPNSSVKLTPPTNLKIKME